MAKGDPNQPNALFILSRMALGMSQREAGEMFHVSLRTVQRWEEAGPSMLAADWHKLVRAVHPRDPDLAARVAKHAGTSLEALGLVTHAAPPSPPQAPTIPLPYLVDSVLYAAKDGDEMQGLDPKPMLIRAFRRAAVLGLDPGEVADLLERSSKVSKKSPA
jgi:hypothetical protein